MTKPASDQEAERVAVLRGYAILESAPEHAYDEIAELAAQVCNCPAAVINFVDDTSIWSKC
jgi:adenylate cyclase